MVDYSTKVYVAMSEKTFSLLLDEFRQAAGIRVEKLASAAGITKRRLENWLTGPSRPYKWQPVVRLAVALHLSEKDADRLLTAIHRPKPYADDRPLSISQLKRLVTDPQEIKLLGNWRGPFVAPLLPEPFVGRDALFAQLTTQLIRPNSVAFVHGMAGVGKTTLCAKIAHQLQDHFGDGVLMVTMPPHSADLTPFLRDRLHWIAILYDDPCPTHFPLDALSDHVRHLLADRHTLLILDNVSSGQQVDYFLPPRWEGALLVTSRKRELRLPTRPDPLDLLPFSPATEAALDLFRAILENDQRVAREHSVLVEISQRVGYLPLALTIIASHLRLNKTWSATEFLEEMLDHDPVYLEFDDRSVYISLDISYQSLTPLQQAGFVMLGAFNGFAFSKEAATALIQLTKSATSRLLRQLQNRALLQLVSPNRYQLHPLVNQFARLHLTDRAVFVRKSDYFKAYAQTHQYNHTQLQVERDNILQSLQDANEYAFSADSVAILEAIAGYLIIYGLHDILTKHLEQGIAQADGRALAKLLSIQGLLAAQKGEDEALSILSQAHALATRWEDEITLMRIAKARGIAAVRHNSAAAQQAWEVGLDLAQTHDYPHEIAIFSYNLTSVLLGQGKSAEPHLTRGLTLARQLNDARLLTAMLNQQAALFIDQGDLPAGHRAYQEALDLARQQNAIKRVIVTLLNLSHTAYLLGRYEESAEYAQEGLDHADHIQADDQKIYLLTNLLQAHVGQRAFAKAEAVATVAFAHLDQHDNPDGKATFYVDYAYLLMRGARRFTQAQEYLTQAWRLIEFGEEPRRTTEIQLALGECELLNAQLLAARAAFTTALTLAQQTDIWHLKVEAYYGLAQTAHQQNDNDTFQRHQSVYKQLLNERVYHRKQQILAFGN